MTNPIEKENFADLLEASLKDRGPITDTVVKGTVVDKDKDFITVDVGLKSEGRIATREFGPNRGADIEIGDVVDVYVDRMENRDGEIVLSRDKARREAAWEELEVLHKKGERVTGVIVNRVKGGFTVDLSGATAFLPGSQIDVRPIKDTSSLMNIEQPFMILKMDRLRGNIVVSRRAILEESMVEARKEIMATIKEGSVLEGTIKNITDYGAFVDLGGIDGLLHVTDISWSRVNHPSDVFQVGDTIQVKVIKINDNNRISLGMKQLQDDPWDGIEASIAVGDEVDGKVSNLADYGAFVTLKDGIEGLVYSTELSWTKKNVHPNKVLNVGDTVKVKVLEVDREKRRISLSMKQSMENPWHEFAMKHPGGTVLEGEVKNFTEFGLFVGLEGGIDGMVHISDLSWEKSGEEAASQFKKGEMIKVKVLEIDVDKERISLGVKQLSEDPFEAAQSLKVGTIVTCVVDAVSDRGLDVSVMESDVKTFIRKGDLAKDRSEQRPERFAVGERLDAQVVDIDNRTRKVILSIKAREAAEEKAAMAEYGSSDSGASLGDILGAAIDLDKIKQTSSDEQAPKKAASKDKVAKKPAAKKEISEEPKKKTTAKKADEDKA